MFTMPASSSMTLQSSGNSNIKSNKKIENTNIFARKFHKYRKRNRNEYIDPLLIVNTMEKMMAKKHQIKPNYLPVPPEIVKKLKTTKPKHVKENDKKRKDSGSTVNQNILEVQSFVVNANVI
eukprot:405748_1